ncbi:MAG: DUF1517 domain-containing protein [Cyanophyceae cyanobacterium]
MNWRERFHQLAGKQRFVVCRLFIHLAGEDVAPLLGVLNQTAREAIAAEGELQVLGEGLVQICQNLLQLSEYWQSAANEGDVFFDEGEAGDAVTELFTDSAQRYLSEPNLSDEEESLSLPVTRNIVVMIAVAYQGEVPELETDLAQVEALAAGLQALINLHYQEKLRAIQVHFSPAQLGDELTDEQLLLNFPELIPL